MKRFQQTVPPGGASAPTGRLRGPVAFAGRHWRAMVHWSVVGAAVGYLAWRVPELTGQLTQSGRQVSHLRWAWLVVAVLCGVGALVAYGELHRQLLIVGGVRLPLTTVQGINFAENAVSTTVPVVGGAGALGYAISQLRRRGVDAALASWSVFLAGLIATLTLLVLGSLGLGWAGRIPMLPATLTALVLISAAASAWIIVTHPEVLRRCLWLVLMLGHRIPAVCRTCRHTWSQQADRVSQRISTRIALLRPRGGQWLLLIALAAVSWVLDFMALVASAAMVGSPVTPKVLIVGFLVVQGSIALQVLPGGAGLAETGLLGVMVASGVAVAPAAASVLIYRSITWLGLSLLGWIIYAAQPHATPTHRHGRIAELPQEEPADAAV